MSSKRSSCRRRLALTLAALLSSQTPVWAGTAFTDVSPADGIFQTPDTHDFWLASLTAAPRSLSWVPAWLPATSARTPARTRET